MRRRPKWRGRRSATWWTHCPLRFGDRFAAVAAVSSFVVNGERAARSTPIADGDEVALLPPVSGGAPAS